jgi:Protein of unknown function (DUF3309)
VAGIVIGGALSCFSELRRANGLGLANEIHQLSFWGLPQEKGKNMGTILIVVLLILLLGGGGGYYGYNRYGAPGLGGVLGLVVIVLIVLWLMGVLGGVAMR